MSKRKTLSAEQKRAALLELFHEKSEVFQLKELESLAPKEKGIVQQAVKTTLEQLVDNGEVNSAKIGISVYYWSIPSQALTTVKHQFAENEALTAQLQATMQDLTKEFQSINSADANEASKLAAMQGEMNELRKERDELRKKIAAFSEVSDYEKIQTMSCDAKKILEAANRWTDNIFCTKSWVKRKLDKTDSQLDKAFGIPVDFDYLET